MCTKVDVKKTSIIIITIISLHTSACTHTQTRARARILVILPLSVILLDKWDKYLVYKLQMARCQHSTLRVCVRVRVCVCVCALVVSRTIVLQAGEKN